VDYAIWSHAGASLSQFDTVDRLKQVIVLDWRALPRRFIDHSIDEWRRRLQCVVDQNLLFIFIFTTTDILNARGR